MSKIIFERLMNINADISKEAIIYWESYFWAQILLSLLENTTIFATGKTWIFFIIFSIVLL